MYQRLKKVPTMVCPNRSRAAGYSNQDKKSIIMPENNKTVEFLKKLAPCIERGELEACVEEAARVAKEMGIEAQDFYV